MALTAESVQVDGKSFRILPFDVERINANMNEGVLHIWHGVAAARGDEQPESGIFASATVRYSRESGRYPEIKEVTTRKIG